MEPGIFYEERLKNLKDTRKSLTRRKSILSWLRLATVVGIVLLVYFLWAQPFLYLLLPVLLLLVIFIRLILLDLGNKDRINHNSQLIKLNVEELKALLHKFHHFPDGQEFLPPLHNYANDLDIFGRASLYQYINRAQSEMGNALLAKWLLAPADTAIILERQQAVKELTTETIWRQELQAVGAERVIKNITLKRLDHWLNEKFIFIETLYWQWLRIVMPVIVILAIILNNLNFVSDIARNYVLLISVIMALLISKKVSSLHEQVSRMSGELEVLTDSLRLIEKKTFASSLLKELQKNFVQDKGSASSTLYKLKKILDRLDMRFNIVISIPLNILFQWDLQQVYQLEKWKQRNQDNINHWFESLAAFEALNSLATLAFNHPTWTYPVIKPAHFFMEGRDMGHPLIPPSKCVNNDIKIERKGELMLVTGSNMAGKSTYLRSVGVNVVLAMAGAPVCASAFALSPVSLISSMRIADNLEESTSTFYAELKKLKTVIDAVNEENHVFILLDEILRGTNSLDRHTGSVALVKQLIRKKASAVIATHDVELAALKTDYPNNLMNYHFDVQVSNDELYFDYKLKEGVCTSLNASILMKKIGIEL